MTFLDLLLLYSFYNFLSCSSAALSTITNIRDEIKENKQTNAPIRKENPKLNYLAVKGTKYPLKNAKNIAI